ncbi:hypothetical protein [Micromonospora zamorensis]|uniref:hypothetical protein n=1 Tax=Micromonospora zamorensis TaxID=709883 RepID=UPI0037B582FA
MAQMLDEAENASPVEAVEAVIRELCAALGARSVAFLIADLSGRVLVRLVHVPLHGAEEGRREGDELAMVMPFGGGPTEQALRTQTVRPPSGWAACATVAAAGWAWSSRPRPRTLTWPHTAPCPAVS